MNPTQKLRLVNSFSAVGLFTLAEKILHNRGSLVFSIHRVLPAEEFSHCYNPDLAITPESLDLFLNFVAKRLPILPLPELLRFNGTSKPSPACAITFDDGWEDNYRIAFPLLKSRGLTATIFLTTDMIGSMQLIPEERITNILAGPNRSKCVELLADHARSRGAELTPDILSDNAALKTFYKRSFPFAAKMKILAECEGAGNVPSMSRFLTWDQVREMQRDGFTFGSHTQRHAILPVNPFDFMMAELVGSKQHLERELGVTTDYFAYPNGMYNRESMNAVKAAGYRAAFTSDTGVISQTLDAYRLPRIPLAQEVVSSPDGRFSQTMAQLLLTRSYLARAKSPSRVRHLPSLSGQRILFMIDALPLETKLGGTELQIRHLISELTQVGVEAHLCILTGKSWESANEYFGCPVHFVGLAEGRVSRRVPGLYGFARWMRARRYSAIQTFFPDSNLLGPFLARLAGVPIVIGSRRNLNYWMSPTWSFFQGAANLFVTNIIANSQAVVAACRKTERFMGSRVCVLYNGVDLDRFKRDTVRRDSVRAQLGLGEENVLIGMVSNLRPVKDLPGFIEAARIVIRQHPQARFAVVGEGPSRYELEQLIAGHGLQDSFMLLGRQSDVPAYLSSFDMAVHSSESEGFSNSVLEYISAGLPVIATDVGGNAEAMGDAGILVPPKDPSALANAIASLVTDSAKRARLGASALSRAAMFGPTPTRQRLLETYSKILQG